MKMKIIFISALFISLSLTVTSQEEKANTLDSQFNDLIENSNSYQTYKVIKITELDKMQRSIRDSIASYETTIVGSKKVISEQKGKIDSLRNQTEALETDLAQTQQKVENIVFLGFPTQKSTYNTIMWTIITVLLLLSIILFFVFKRGHSNTKDAREKLAVSESELDGLRKRSLEREQKVRRELQDEINKNRLRKE